MKVMSDQEFAKMLEKARAHDAEMERTESEVGFASPKRCDLPTHLRTVEQAFECAVRMRDWQTACEGIVMLQQAIARLGN